MAFFIDKQTISDFELFSYSEKIPSIFGFYNRTVTKGGQEKLYNIIKAPESDIDFLENRKKEIDFFCNTNNPLKLNKRQLDYIEHYLSSPGSPLRDNLIDATKDGLANKIKPTQDYYTIVQGIFNAIWFLVPLSSFIKGFNDFKIPDSIKNKLEAIETFLNIKPISKIIKDPPKKSNDLKYININKLDYIFRKKHENDFRDLLNTIYEIDVLQSLCILINEEGFSLAEYSSGQQALFELEGGFHPLLKDPIKNNFNFSDNSSLCFLTGPNMSGKSTFLKTIAIITYFSHLGLPVPASRLRTSLFNGLFTTINISDEINQGLSHFYAEVKRVKEMSLAIQKDNKLIIILDELFRGTNVKDAHDGTLMIIKLLSQIKGSVFFISSHIIEVAEILKSSNNIDFKCFESTLNNEFPEYDYKLKDGVTSERIGLQIIRNENIENILSEIISLQRME